MRLVTFVAAVALLVSRCATPAWADAPATADVIVVISDDSAFRTEVGVALAPSNISVRIASDPAPAIAEITTQSRAIADREHASATVWLLFVDQGATLIAYDRGVDRVLVRSLPYGTPLADAQAAEAARIAGTMLRALREVEEPKKPPPPPVIDPEPPRVIVVAPPAPSHLGIDLDGGVRVRGPGATAAPAGALGVIWRPDRLGLVVTARLAPGADVGGMLDGRISDQSLAIAARWPLAVAPKLAVVTTGGVAAHRIALDGTIGGKQGAGADVRNRRYDPAARVGVAASYDLNPTIALGIGVSTDVLLRRQSYDVGTAQVVAVPMVQVSLGLVLIVRIL